MHRTRLDRGRGVRGFTLLEMIVTMVIAAVVLGTTLFFAYPVQQAGDVTTRAELTDMADNALQRIGRDVRLALPNSVRVRNNSGVFFLEFVPVRTGGRYLIESTSTAACGSGTDGLAFDSADGCFKSIGTIPNDGTVVGSSDSLVLNNYGEGFTGQSVYQTTGTLNRRLISTVTSATTVSYTPTTAFDRRLHDSPGRRFFIVTTPVSYVCDPGAKTLIRYAGYDFADTQPTSFSTTAALVATDVSACAFDYSRDVAPQVGLLTLRLTLSKAVSTGTESVALYHAIHVNNVP
jgi:MSHA biogenesis protein MshO